MGYDAKVYQVMIASPSDIIKERHLAAEVIHEWNAVNSKTSEVVLLPASWETHSAPLAGDRPQEVINKQVLKNSDLLVGIFCTRIGTPTGEFVSGTVEEIEKHIKAGKPAMLYFSDIIARSDSIDYDQYEKLMEFKEEYWKKALLGKYSSIAEFRQNFSRHLGILINTNDYFELKTLTDSPQETVSSIHELVIDRISEDAELLLVEASRDRSGTISRLNTNQGLIIRTNGKQFTQSDNHRSEAQWEAAVQELYSNGLIKDKGYKGELSTITNSGYKLADKIKDGK